MHYVLCFNGVVIIISGKLMYLVLEVVIDGLHWQQVTTS